MLVAAGSRVALAGRAASEPKSPCLVYPRMSYRILYFRGGILEDVAEAQTSDIVEAAKLASSQHRQLTAEIWADNRKVAICRPSWDHRFKHSES